MNWLNSTNAKEIGTLYLILFVCLFLLFLFKPTKRTKKGNYMLSSLFSKLASPSKYIFNITIVALSAIGGLLGANKLRVISGKIDLNLLPFFIKKKEAAAGENSVNELFSLLSLSGGLGQYKALDIYTKSFFLPADFWDSFTTLQQIALAFLAFKSVILSSITSIIFIYFGDFLLAKYNLEIRYPKLAKIIMLRRKFSKYYFILNCGTIIIIALTEASFIIYVYYLDAFQFLGI